MIARQILENMKNGSAIRSMFEAGQQLKARYGDDRVFDFSLGNPDVPAPPAVQDAFLAAVLESGTAGHGYMNNAGLDTARRAVAERESARAGRRLEAGDVVMTVGAAGALAVLFKAILDPGDDVITFAPCFGEYHAYVQNAGGRLVTVPTTRPDFLPDLNALADAVGPRTKAVLINSPNNPTGQLYDRAVLEQIRDVIEAEDHCIYLISDEPYAELIYDGETQLPSVLSVFQNSLVAYSWSKSLSLPGERIGYIAAAPTCEDHDNLMAAMAYCNRTLGFVNAPALLQRVVTRAIGCRIDPEVYRRRRDRLHDILTRCGFSCFLPRGAFYLFPVCPEPDDRHFAAVCLSHRLLCAPGSAFDCPGYFRLSFCVSEDTIRRSEPVFETIARSYGLI